jgi:cell division transport system ATP-binding protein
MLRSFKDDGPIVDIVKVTKVYPPDIAAVQNVSLAVSQGELLFLTGKSGAGKTTLLKMICCIEKPNKGIIEVGGQDLSRLKQSKIQQLRQQIGVVYQDFKVLPKQTVFQNIAIPMEVLYRSPKEIRQRVGELLEMLKITHKKDIQTDKLSRGEQQRVAIARAAANTPPLILADEPTGNLDSEASTDVMNLFEQMNRSGTTIIIATHDKSIYENTRHRKIELEHGLFSSQMIHKQLPLIDM